MLYVLAVWLCAVGCVALIELCVLSVPQTTSSFLQTLNTSQPDLAAELTSKQAPMLILGLAVFLVCLILGYISEWRLKPIRRLYLALQKQYPAWYRALPADWREVLLSLGVCLLCLIPAVAYTLLTGLNPSAIAVLAGALGLSLGLILPPLLRYRNLLDEDRPEQPPQAVLHKVVRNYSLERALKIGQLYLRLLLPVFSLFCMIVVPLALQQVQLGALETGLLLACMMIGVALGWYSHPESTLEFSNFRRNLYQLCALSLLAAAFLCFGVASGNLAELILMGTFSGYLAGLY